MCIYMYIYEVSGAKTRQAPPRPKTLYYAKKNIMFSAMFVTSTNGGRRILYT